VTLEKKKLKKKKKKPKKELVLFQESLPFWKDSEKPVKNNQFLMYRHGVAKGLKKLKNHFYVVIVIWSKCSLARQRQIVNSLGD
jgi:hypothetical protein